LQDNVIYDSQQQGIRVSDGASSVDIQFNTIVQLVAPGDEVVHYDPSGVDGTYEAILFHEGSSGTVKNNLLVGNDSWACIGVDAATIIAGFTEDYNLVYHSGATTEDQPLTYEFTGFGSHDVVEQDPLLPAVDDTWPGYLTDYLEFSNFAPGVGSPAIGAAENGGTIGAVSGVSTIIPEPGAVMALVGMGLMTGLGVLYRRRRNGA